MSETQQRPAGTVVPGPGSGPEEHGASLARGALNLAGNVGMALGSVGPTASIALTISAILVASGYASPIAILICGLPMLGIAAAFRRLNRWRVNCGATYVWGGRAVSPYYGFAVGWIIVLAYVVGLVSIVLPIGPYLGSLFGHSDSRMLEAIIGFLALVFVTAISYVGIRMAAWVQWVMIAIEYIGVGVLAIVALIAVFTHNVHAVPFSWSWFSWKEMGGIGGLVSAALLAVYMYSGWDTGILLNEETTDARESPGNAVVLSVIVAGLMFAFLQFAIQGGASKHALETQSNALSYVGGLLGGSVLAKWMILAVGLSAIGSTMGTLVSGVRISFAMGADGVLPRAFAFTHPKFKTPTLATIVIAVLGAIGVWLYTLGSSSVVNSFDIIVSVDGLLFALFYALTGLSTAVYFRKLAVRSPWGFVQLAVFPLASAGFLFFVVWDSIPGLGGWTGKNMISLYVMLAIGAAILAWSRLRRTSDYFDMEREAYEPDAPQPAGLSSV